MKDNIINNKIDENDITEKPLLKPKIDIVFQSLFNKNNIKITKSFVEALLDEKIEKIIINEDKELLRNNPNDKLGILDLELDINDKEKVDVEVQLIKKDNLIKRLIWYFSRLYVDQLDRGDRYEELKKVVIIAIVDFEIEELKDIKGMETIWKLIETKKREKILTDIFEIHIINMKKAEEMYNMDKTNKKAQWILFLDNPNKKEVKEIMEDNEDIKEAVIEVKKMTEDEKMKRLAFLRQKALLDEEDIRLSGYNDGKVETKKEIIKKLSNMNVDIDEIAIIVEMDKEEVEEIIKKCIS